MSLGSMLYDLIIGPLKTIFEIIYWFGYDLIGNPGIAIIFLSLVMNLLLLPMYKRTDEIQFEAMEKEKKMHHWVEHIKKTFKGDERFMMLQTYYRQNNYKQSDVLKGISPLLLEIPFFMAAYDFLSNLEILEGQSFGLISNLGSQDGIIAIAGITINLLPVLMTVINIISSAIYTKGAPMKTKLQLYVMAAIFLVLLYDSPSGLVLYWTLNNLFSLVKNFIISVKEPKKLVTYLSSVSGLACLALVFILKSSLSSKKLLIVILVGILLNLPLALRFIKPKQNKHMDIFKILGDFDESKLFYTSAVLLTVLIGLNIPSALLASSPDEFIINGLAYNPVNYVIHSALIAAGIFLLWLVVFYKLVKPSWKKVFAFVTCLFSLGAVVDYMAFGKNYGNMSRELIYDKALIIPRMDMLINGLVLIAVLIIVYILWKKKHELLKGICLTATLAFVLMAGLNIYNIQNVVQPKIDSMNVEDNKKAHKIIPLSKEGKNVVVLMMDRAINSYFPYVINEDPKIKEQFEGFTYYPNTVSFGAYTNFGLSSLMGGYEYTPLEMNKRSDEWLVDKHNEALKVMPVLFDNNGFEVTVCDPSYAGYFWMPDLSIYDDYPDIDAYVSHEEIAKDDAYLAHVSEGLNRNFFFYSVFRAVPVIAQTTFYDYGRYLDLGRQAGQIMNSNLTATGSSPTYRKFYDVLNQLADLTEIKDGDQNTFMMMCNETPHSPTLLQMPDYSISDNVDNTAFEKPNPERYDADGNKIVMDSLMQITHYYVNVTSYRELGNWFDFLRENDVYDNTRIIVVSDHGYNVKQFEDRILGEGEFDDAMMFNPVLLVKDFNSHETKVDETFMANADTPLIAMNGLIDNPVNPFTGKDMASQVNKTGEIYIFGSNIYDTSRNNGKTFIPGPWFKVHDDVRTNLNWKRAGEGIFPEE